MNVYVIFYLLFTVLDSCLCNQNDFVSRKVTNAEEFWCKKLKLIKIDRSFFALPKNYKDVKTRFYCDGVFMSLSCSVDEMIKIIKVNYGRSDTTTCKKSEKTSSKMCSHPEAVNIVKQICQNKNACMLKVGVASFGDRCPLVDKYLEVQYACEKAQSALACEGEVMKLSCDDEKLLVIGDAYYERSNRNTCSGLLDIHTRKCPPRDALEQVQFLCENRHSCEIVTDDHEFGEPCPLVVRHLKVKYNCERSNEDENVAISPGPPKIETLYTDSAVVLVDKGKMTSWDLYKVEAKLLRSGDWFELKKKGNWDFSQDIMLFGLTGGGEYDLRIYLRSASSKDCIPYTRFKLLTPTG